jgi:hypothetical protein
VTRTTKFFNLRDFGDLVVVSSSKSTNVMTTTMSETLTPAFSARLNDIATLAFSSSTKSAGLETWMSMEPFTSAEGGFVGAAILAVTAVVMPSPEVMVVVVVRVARLMVNVTVPVEV